MDIYARHMSCPKGHIRVLRPVRLGPIQGCLAGGMGYAKEYHVERWLREIWIARIAPVCWQLALSFIADKELDLPKSY